jgi:hypothetical protein
LNPNTTNFELDTRLKWNGSRSLSGFVGKVEERKSRAEMDYNHFISSGHKVRVSESLLPGVFWIVEKHSEDEKLTTAFLEIPVHSNFYEGNLYIELKNKSAIQTYKGIFHSIWKNSQEWKQTNPYQTA